VKAWYREELSSHCKDIKGYEKVRDFLLVSEDFSVDNDMLTPKMSLKRRNIVARYEASLEALYADATKGND
jgi:long-chain acyl-CoA synthetase